MYNGARFENHIEPTGFKMCVFPKGFCSNRNREILKGQGHEIITG
jgi:hypothetical protein